VGKTSLIRQYIEQEFDEKYISTVGASVNTKDISVALPELGQTLDLKYLVWDIAGQKVFSDVDASYFKGADGALLVCDLTTKTSLQTIPNWLSKFKNIAGDVPYLILVNKSDLKALWSFQPKEAEQVAQRYNSHTLVTSAKTGENVEKAFEVLGGLIAKAHVGYD
jgi:small GTP-binding protein